VKGRCVGLRGVMDEWIGSGVRCRASEVEKSEVRVE
jgi:hypothetical protein